MVRQPGLILSRLLGAVGELPSLPQNEQPSEPISSLHCPFFTPTWRHSSSPTFIVSKLRVDIFFNLKFHSNILQYLKGIYAKQVFPLLCQLIHQYPYLQFCLSQNDEVALLNDMAMTMQFLL